MPVKHTTAHHKVAHKKHTTHAVHHKTGTHKTGTHKANRWLEHVHAFRVRHPHLSYRECLMEAKKTYHK